MTGRLLLVLVLLVAGCGMRRGYVRVDLDWWSGQVVMHNDEAEPVTMWITVPPRSTVVLKVLPVMPR